MRILRTCLKAGHRWGAPTPIPFADGTLFAEARQCQRHGCRRYRIDYPDGRVVTYDTPASEYADVEDPIWDLKVVRAK